jgi:hypothetical protein
MLNDTTKPGEVLHKGGLDLLTLLNRRVAMKTDNACRTIKDSQKRWACFDAEGPEPSEPD